MKATDIPAIAEIKANLLDEEVSHVLDTEDPNVLILPGSLLDLLEKLGLVFLTLLGDLRQMN